MILDTVRQTLKQITPAPVWSFLRNTYWLHIHDRSWYEDPRGRESQARLRSMHDRYRGERCFILGNGPSLRRMDLTPLRHEYTFGLNRIYLLFSELGFTTSFLVSINDLVIAQCAAEIDALTLPKFITWRARDVVTFDEHTIFVRSGVEEIAFSTDPVSHVNEGATVTFVAMQLAYFLGFEEVILIGVDHSFKTKGPAHKVVVSEGDDPNHFAANYFGKGFRWQLPDLETSELAYAQARRAFEQDGRRIVDATVGGKLEVFPKVAYESLF